MQCSVDVTESVVELLRVWCRCAVFPLIGLSRRSIGRWSPWACHATDHKNFITNRFQNFCWKQFSNKQAIITQKMCIMFNLTILILTFFLRDPLKLTFTNISLTQLVENLILYKFSFYISSLSLILI